MSRIPPGNRKRGRTRAILATTLSAALAPLMILNVQNAEGSSTASSPLNRSDNPILARNADGYSIQEGASRLSRVPVTDHTAASYALRVVSSASTTRVREPREPVTAGRWTFASDVEARGGATAQITVSWFDAAGRFLSWSGGSGVKTRRTQWTRVAASLQVPQRAASAETVVNVIGTVKGASVLLTQHDVRAPVATPQTPPPTTEPPTPTTEPPTPTTEPPTPTTQPPTSLANLPAQAAGVTYGSASGARPYAHPGGLVIAGRDNYQGQAFKDVSAAGGHVLIYLDAVIDNPYGRYHSLLVEASACGPATSRWPGSPKANSYGYVNDFRVGSVLQRKLECVLEKMVAENPHMAGWFADDLGSRSWFPGFRWETWGSANQQAYRDGAVALTQTFRKVADRHGLVFMVNGTWSGGSVSSSGGGYPDRSVSGNALADGGFVEHHDGQIGYFGPYGCSPQWAAQSPVTRGKAFNYAVTSTAAGRTEYARSGCYAYVNQQNDYGSVAPWGSFHPTGLPSSVSR